MSKPNAEKQTDEKPPEEGTPKEGEETPERVTLDMTQSELDALIGKTKGEATTKATDKAKTDADAKAASDKKAAAEQNLIENKEFQDLANQRGTEIEELTSRNTVTAGELDATKTQLDAANAALLKQLEVIKKDVPEHVKPLLERMSATEQLDYLAEHAAEFTKPDDDGAGGNPDRTQRGGGHIPPTPDSNGRLPKKATDDDKRKQSTGLASYF